MINRIFFLIAVFTSSASYAIDSGNDFVSSQALPINSLMLIIATMLGLFVFGSGLYGVSKSSTMPQQYPVSSCVTKMITGVLLLSITAFYNVVMKSVGFSDGSATTLSVQDSALLSSGVSMLSNSAMGEILPQETIQILLAFIYLVGLYSFLKGVYMLKDVGGSPNQNQGQSVVKSSLVHIVAGIIAMNITMFSCILGSTLGLSQMCSN